MERLTARFVTTSKLDNYVKALPLDGITLYWVEYGEEDAKKNISRNRRIFR